MGFIFGHAKSRCFFFILAGSAVLSLSSCRSQSYRVYDPGEFQSRSEMDVDMDAPGENSKEIPSGSSPDSSGHVESDHRGEAMAPPRSRPEPLARPDADLGLASGEKKAPDGSPVAVSGQTTQSGMLASEPHGADHPTEIIPIPVDLAPSLIRSFDAGIRRGPDCNDSIVVTRRDEGCPPLPPRKVVSILWSLVVPTAFAALRAPGPSVPDRSISQAQLLKLARRGSEAWNRYLKISNIHIFSNSKGNIMSDFNYIMTFTNGEEIWGRGNSSSKIACLLIEKTFPKNGKEFFDAVEFYGNKVIKLKNPIRGKACKAPLLNEYRILNLSVDQKKQNRIPSFVMLLAKDPRKNQSYVLRKRFQGEQDFLSVLLAQLNKERLGDSKISKTPGGKLR